MYLIPVSEVEAICNEIELALSACGRKNETGIVRSKFCQPRKALWVDDVSKCPERELSLLDWSSVVPDSVRVSVN